MDFGSILEGFWAPNSHFFRCFSLSFFGFIFGLIFLRFFVDFWPLETLKIELPPARELNFDKIDGRTSVFLMMPCMYVWRVSLHTQFWSKNDGSEGPKSMQNWRKSMKKMCLKTNAFLPSIFLKNFIDFGSQVEAQKQVPRSFLLGMVRSCAQEAPKRPQERPKRPQEAPKRHPGGPKSSPRCPQEVPRGPQESSKSGQE